MKVTVAASISICVLSYNTCSQLCYHAFGCADCTLTVKAKPVSKTAATCRLKSTGRDHSWDLEQEPRRNEIEGSCSKAWAWGALTMANAAQKSWLGCWCWASLADLELKCLGPKIQF